MKLPRYWAKGTVKTTDQCGRTHSFSCWGWSDLSLGDAEKKGEQRAANIAQRVLKGQRLDRYLYTNRPLREEILQEFTDSQGTTYAAITRNSYGCHVLNTTNVMFVDVDLPVPTLVENIKYRLQKLLGKSAPPPTRQHELEALVKVQAMTQADSQCAVRVYRTRAGLRYLLTHGLVDPDAESTLRAMEAFGADPLYVKLCKAQESFRARLTPKPWRCGIAAPSERFPWPDAKAETRFRQWERNYLAATEQFATCKLVGELGGANVHPEVAPIIELHDQLTKAASELQLA